MPISPVFREESLFWILLDGFKIIPIFSLLHFCNSLKNNTQGGTQKQLFEAKIDKLRSTKKLLSVFFFFFIHNIFVPVLQLSLFRDRCAVIHALNTVEKIVFENWTLKNLEWVSNWRSIESNAPQQS